MSASQIQADTIAILDFVERILVNLTCFLYPLLEGSYYPERKTFRLLSKILQKTDILIICMRISLGPQKLGKFINQDKHAG